MPPISVAFIGVAHITVIADVYYEWWWGGRSGMCENVCEVISYGAGCGYADGRWCEHGRLNVQEQEHTIASTSPFTVQDSGGIVSFGGRDPGIIEVYHFMDTASLFLDSLRFRYSIDLTWKTPVSMMSCNSLCALPIEGKHAVAVKRCGCRCNDNMNNNNKLNRYHCLAPVSIYSIPSNKFVYRVNLRFGSDNHLPSGLQ